MRDTEQGFRGEFFFLSNFFNAPTEVFYHDERFLFATGEHVFQGMKIASLTDKTPTTHSRLLRELEANSDPQKAKYWGRSVKIDKEAWDQISYKCMRRTLDLKFSQHANLAEKLIQTDGTELVEYNSWNDTLWGKNEKTRQGKNQLGVLLMELRERLLQQ